MWIMRRSGQTRDLAIRRGLTVVAFAAVVLAPVVGAAADGVETPTDRTARATANASPATFDEAARRVTRPGSAASPPPGAAAKEAGRSNPVTVRGVRSGRHGGHLRLVLDLDGRPVYQASATAGDAFLLTLRQGRWAVGPGTRGAPPLTVSRLRPADPDGGLRLRLSSDHPAFIKRSFVLAPAADDPMAPWRLVVDLMPVPGARPAQAAAGETTHSIAVALPAPHGLVPGLSKAPGPLGAPVPTVAPLGPPAPASAAIPATWTRASRILKELRDRIDPKLDGAPPSQLVLPAKYRRNLVPLR